MQKNSTTESLHLPDYFAKVARVDLAFLPTPLHEATRLSKALGGPRIFLKRDDLISDFLQSASF